MTDYIALFDFDSHLYHSVYRIVSISDMKALLRSEPELEYHERKQKAFDYIIDEAFDRMGAKTLNVFEAIEETGIQISQYEFFITTCEKSIRKAISPEYKAKRKKNKWVSALRSKLINEGTVSFSSQYEADDLIYDRAKELRKEDKNYIVISIDKDLKQIEGFHYDYYPIKELNTETGLKEFIRHKGLSYTSEFESRYMIAKQMLSGDSGDGVQGLKGIGEKRAEKILEGKKSHFTLLLAVIRTYVKHYDSEYLEPLMCNFRLLKLGKDLEL